MIDVLYLSTVFSPCSSSSSLSPSLSSPSSSPAASSHNYPTTPEALYAPFLDILTTTSTPSPLFQLTYLETVVSTFSAVSDVVLPFASHPRVHVVRGGPGSGVAEMEERAGWFAREGERLFLAVYGRDKGRVVGRRGDHGNRTEEEGKEGQEEQKEEEEEEEEEGAEAERGFFKPSVDRGPDDDEM